MLVKKQGYTLLEILIALFIFTFVAMIAGKALHSVMGTQKGVEAKASELRSLQLALLLFSRDLSEALAVPPSHSDKSEDGSFAGNSKGLRFTHLGLANTEEEWVQSGTQCHHYLFRQGQWRRDQRILLEDLSDLEYRYLDKKKRFHHRWPPEGSEESDEQLPRAVEVTLIFKKQGKLRQLYLLPQQEITHARY